METIKKTILWLDDDLSTPALRTETDFLSSRGFQIIATENPDDFFTALKDSSYDCIVIDITLPLGETIEPGEARGGMRTGLVLLRKLIKESSASVPIVVYTIVEDNDVKTFCKENSILYINKFEVFPWTLADELEALLKKGAKPSSKPLEK